jgi:hypothetical protein
VPVDAGAVDAAADAGSPPSDAGSGDGGPRVPKCSLPNLLPNGDFENGAVRWLPQSTETVTPTATAAAGSRSATICTRAGRTYGTVENLLPASASGVTRVHMRMWTREAPEGKSPSRFDGQFSRVSADSGAPVSHKLTQFEPTWRCSESIHEYGPYTMLNLTLFPSDADAGMCMGLDEIEVTELPASGNVPAECQCPV